MAYSLFNSILVSLIYSCLERPATCASRDCNFPCIRFIFFPTWPKTRKFHVINAILQCSKQCSMVFSLPMCIPISHAFLTTSSHCSLIQNKRVSCLLSILWFVQVSAASHYSQWKNLLSEKALPVGMSHSAIFAIALSNLARIHP